MVRKLSVLALLVLLLGMTAPVQVAFADDTEIFLPVITAGSGEQQQDRAAETGNAARSEGYPWKDHAAPYTYLFGNRMDQHQQSKEVGQDQLNGFLYISFTGKIHEDPEQGSIPVAKHVDCANPPEREDGEPMSCTIGWIMHGIRVQGKLLTYGSGGASIHRICPTSRAIPTFTGNGPPKVRVVDWARIARHMMAT